MKRILLVLSLLVAACIVFDCGSLASLYFRLFVWDPFEMKQAIKQYNGSTSLFEETAPVLTNTYQDTLYYWTADPIDNVRATYEKAGLKFVNGTSQHDWWITLYNKNGLPQLLPTSPFPITDHQAICEMPYRFNWSYLTGDEAEDARLEAEKTKEFGCISIALVKADHPSLCTLSVIFPGNQGYQPDRTAPYENCPRFPRQGTLIIFNYYLEGM